MRKLSVLLVLLLLMQQVLPGTARAEEPRSTKAPEYTSEELTALSNDPEAYKRLKNTKEREKQNPDGIAPAFVGNSPFLSGVYNHADRFNGYKILNGIDVSFYQGKIDWDQVKKSGTVDFAILRAGFRGYVTPNLVTDSQFTRNMSETARVGIPVGVYFFTQAVTTAEAREEAQYVVNLLQEGKYTLALPIIIDFEYAANAYGACGRLYDAKLSKEKATSICAAFCDEVEKSGYDAMVYSNPNFYTNQLNASSLSGKYGIWLAHYTNSSSYKGDYTIWQYSSKGSVRGISGNVDCNFWYQPPENIVPKTVTLTAGSSKTLSIPSEAEAYRWESSAPTVAYVGSSGKVTAVSKGIAEIRVFEENALKDRYQIIVNESLNAYQIEEIPDQVADGSALEPDVKVRSKEELPVSAKAVGTPVLKNGAGKTYDDIAQLSEGQELTVLGRIKDWYAVAAKIDGKTVGGYCTAEQLEITFAAVRTLTIHTDYTVSYSNHVAAGTATATATGKGGGAYQGSISQSFEILTSMKNCTLTVPASKVYTGKTIRPKVTVNDGAKTLKKGVDYALSYGENVDVGKGTVTVTGLGKYSGTKSISFRIVPAKVTGLKKTAASASKIKLCWKRAAGAAGYVIYRASVYNGAFHKVKTIPSGKTLRWTDSGLVSGYGYYYKVRAYKKAGRSTCYGAYSSVVNPETKRSGLGKAAANTAQTLYKKPASGKVVSVSKGASLKILSRTVDTSGRTWYHVKYTKNKKTYSGYVNGIRVVVKNLKGSGKVVNRSIFLRKSAKTNAAKLTRIQAGQKVTVLGAVKGSDAYTWYKISFKKGGKRYTGYSGGRYIHLTY